MDRMTAMTIADKIKAEWGAGWSAAGQRDWVDAIEPMDRTAALRAVERYRRQAGARPSIDDFRRVVVAQQAALEDAARPRESSKLDPDVIELGRRNIAEIKARLAARGIA